MILTQLIYFDLDITNDFNLVYINLNKTGL